MKKKVFIFTGTILCLLILGGIFLNKKYPEMLGNKSKAKTESDLTFKDMARVNGSNYKFLFEKDGENICVSSDLSFEGGKCGLPFKTEVKYNDGKTFVTDDYTPPYLLYSFLIPDVSKVEIIYNEDGHISTLNISGVSSDDVKNYVATLKSSYETALNKLRRLENNGSDYENNTFVIKAKFHNTLSANKYIGFYHIKSSTSYGNKNDIKVDKFTKEGNVYKSDSLTFDSTYLKKYDFILDCNELGDHNISFKIDDEAVYNDYLKYLPNLPNEINEDINGAYSDYKMALNKYRNYAPNEVSKDDPTIYIN